MTTLFKTLSLLVLVLLVFTGIQNGAANAPLILANGSIVQWSVGTVILVAALLGAFVVVGLVLPVLDELRKQKQRSARSAEKLEVSAESSGEKVKALEAKIQTLEKALDDALARH